MTPAGNREVAVIGAGPAGLAAARWLTSVGMQPVVFEAGAGIGGQWRQGTPTSGVWPDMRTNTSRVVTRFSDLDHKPGTPVFPASRDVLTYLERYAGRFGLDQWVKTSAKVSRVEHHAGGAWRP